MLGFYVVPQHSRHVSGEHGEIESGAYARS